MVFKTGYLCLKSRSNCLPRVLSIVLSDLIRHREEWPEGGWFCAPGAVADYLTYRSPTVRQIRH
jgi:hypothetical protein